MKRAVWRRLTLLVVAVVVVGTLVALPSAAYAAKATTRLVAVKSMTVNRNTPGINPWPKSLAVKLQKRVTRTHYHPLSGTVKLYRFDPAYGSSGSYRLVATRKGSSLTFSLPGRGKYKLYYAGTSKTKSATAYTGVYETIGMTISEPTITVEAIPATTQSWVHVKYQVNWNTEAVGEVVLDHEQAFVHGDNYRSYIGFDHESVAPGTVELSHKVEDSDKSSTLWTWRVGSVWSYLRGDYVKTPAAVEREYSVP